MNINTTSVNLTTQPVPKGEIQKNQKTDNPIVLDKQAISELINEKVTTKVQEEEKTDQELSKEQAEEVAENIEKMAKIVSSKLQFEVHEETQRIMIRVVDAETQEVIREVPPEQVLNADAKFREVLHLIGVLMDEKA
jgi:flagellar protein FlaG